MSKFSAVSLCSSFIWVTHLVNGAQLLNVTLVFLLTPVVFPVTRIYTSEWLQRLDVMIVVSSLTLESFSFPSPYSVLFWSLITYHFLWQILKIYYQCHLVSLQSFEFSSYIWFIIKPNQTKARAFSENSKDFSSNL